MNIEERVLLKSEVDFEKLKKYGFIKYDKDFILEKSFMDGLFNAVIKVNSNGQVSGTVYDAENNEEFLPLRVETGKGAFVGEVRNAYKNLLEDINKNCFLKKYYIFAQSNRIANLVIQKWGNTPEFLWKTTPGTGIFRNSDTKKWYLAILDIDRSKIQKAKKGLVEVALIKLLPENVVEQTRHEHIYPGYHMNKKHWISVILDDSLSDGEIMNLIDESYNLSNLKPAKRR